MSSNNNVKCTTLVRDVDDLDHVDVNTATSQRPCPKHTTFPTVPINTTTHPPPSSIKPLAAAQSARHDTRAPPTDAMRGVSQHVMPVIHICERLPSTKVQARKTYTTNTRNPRARRKSVIRAMEVVLPAHGPPVITMRYTGLEGSLGSNEGRRIGDCGGGSIVEPPAAAAPSGFTFPSSAMGLIQPRNLQSEISVHQ